MAACTRTGPPGPLPGTEGLTPRNEAHLIWWTLRARLHGPGMWWLVAATIVTVPAWTAYSLGTGTAVMFGATAAALFLAGLIVFVAAVQLAVNARRRRQGWLLGYVTDEATQLVHPDAAGQWVLSDHLARRRGRGLTTDFRRRVCAHLASEADKHRSVIVMATCSKKLGLIYTQDMAQLRTIDNRRTINGPTWKLRRDPRAGRSDEN